MKAPFLLALLLAGCDAQPAAPAPQENQANAAAPAPLPTANGSTPADEGLPALTGRVVDNANLLTADEESRLAASLEVLERRTTDQVVIVTVPSLGGRTIEAFALTLANHWGIGQEDKDNGVLVVLAREDRRVRIEVGYGLESILTNQRADEIIRDDIAPHLRQERWFAALEAATSSIATLLVVRENEPRRGRP